jgi:hypothetical protein
MDIIVRAAEYRPRNNLCAIPSGIVTWFDAVTIKVGTTIVVIDDQGITTNGNVRAFENI